MTQRYLITGATGFVGGHLAEACVQRGIQVHTIARPTSDVALLEKLGAVIHRGDLTDAAVVRQAVEQADVIVNCAAKVGDTGSIEEYRAVNVEPLRVMLEQCRDRPLQCFVHLSSLGVYAARHHYQTDEAEPLPAQHIDGYTQTKVESEQLALEYHKKYHLPVVVLRPGFIYGPRDRTVLPRIIRKLGAGKIHYLGGDQRALNTIYVGNLVDAIFLAIGKPQCLGQVFNLTDGEAVTKQRFFEAISNGLNLPKPHKRLPAWLAAVAVQFLRWQGSRAVRLGRKPWLSPAQYKFLLLNLDFSIEKAKRELGYRPAVGFDTAMKQTLAWYRDNG